MQYTFLPCYMQMIYSKFHLIWINGFMEKVQTNRQRNAHKVIDIQIYPVCDPQLHDCNWKSLRPVVASHCQLELWVKVQFHGRAKCSSQKNIVSYLKKLSLYLSNFCIQFNQEPKFLSFPLGGRGSYVHFFFGNIKNFDSEHSHIHDDSLFSISCYLAKNEAQKQKMLFLSFWQFLMNLYTNKVMSDT